VTDHLNFVREFEWAQKADGVQFSQPTVPWLERSEMTKANFDSAAPEMAFPLGSLVEEPVSTVPSEHLYSNPAGPSPPSNF
jgi:hypothetical protein